MCSSDLIGQVSPHAMMIHLSSSDGSGLPTWYDWLTAQVPAPATTPLPRVVAPAPD